MDESHLAEAIHKKLMRARVVPTISASNSCVILGTTGSATPSFPN
jgi:hypothetical protein